MLMQLQDIIRQIVYDTMSSNSPPWVCTLHSLLAAYFSLTLACW